MATEHGVKRGRMSQPEADVHNSGILTPLYEEGEKGGNPESPAPEELQNSFADGVPDPMGFLKKLGPGGREK